MDVGEIIRKVCGIADYDPEDDGYRRLVRAFVSQGYLWLMALKPWTFARRHVDLTLMPDYTTGTITVAAGSTVVTGAATNWGALAAYAEILLPDGNWYKVRRRASATQLILVTALGGTTNYAGETYTLRQRYTLLPIDLCDFEGIAARGENARPIHYLSTPDERSEPLTEDDEGPPSRFIDADVWHPRSPDEALVASDDTSAGSLRPSTLHRYCYTWLVHGGETAPSPVVEITTSDAASHSIDLTNLLECLVNQNTARVYRALGEGPFYKLVDLTGAVAYTDDGSVAVDKDVRLVADGRYQYLRFWPRTTAAEVVDLEYHSSGDPLIADTDVPAMLPKEFHKVLVDLALVEVFNRNGDVAKASFYNKRAKEVIDDMIQRKLDHDAAVTVRRRWTDGAERIYNTMPIVKL